jgi:hypothetical protein
MSWRKTRVEPMSRKEPAFTALSGFAIASRSTDGIAGRSGLECASRKSFRGNVDEARAGGGWSDEDSARISESGRRRDTSRSRYAVSAAELEGRSGPEEAWTEDEAAHGASTGETARVPRR